MPADVYPQTNAFVFCLITTVLLPDSRYQLHMRTLSGQWFAVSAGWLPVGSLYPWKPDYGFYNEAETLLMREWRRFWQHQSLSFHIFHSAAKCRF